MELTGNRHGKILVVVVGPTAVGKTTFSIELARRLGAEIISGDSRQIYKELTIGTAKPSEEQLKQVRHYLINSHSINDQYDAGMFAKDVGDILTSAFREKDIMILSGGSGMYIDAVCSGLNEIPKVPKRVRTKFNNLYKEKGLEHLSRILKAKDPEYHQNVDQSNPQRIIRALEVIDFCGEKFSSFLTGPLKQEQNFRTIKIGLNLDREKLYQRIDERMEQMIEKGLFNEAEKLYTVRDLYALQTVGYTEIFDFLDGKFDKEETIRLLKRNSRRYAKRQLTWFKRDTEVTWFTPDEIDKVVDYLQALQ